MLAALTPGVTHPSHSDSRPGEEGRTGNHRWWCQDALTLRTQPTTARAMRPRMTSEPPIQAAQVATTEPVWASPSPGSRTVLAWSAGRTVSEAGHSCPLDWPTPTTLYVPGASAGSVTVSTSLPSALECLVNARLLVAVFSDASLNWAPFCPVTVQLMASPGDQVPGMQTSVA